MAKKSDVITQVLEITATNVGNIQSLTIKPNERAVTEITGENGVGKSFALALIDMLADTKCVPDMPIKQGKEEAEITGKVRATINGSEFDIFLSRKFTKKNPKGRVMVQPAQIGEFKTPAAIMNHIFGDNRVVASPNGFTKKSTDDQVKLLSIAASTDVDLQEIEDVVRSSGAENFLIAGDSTYEKIMSADGIVREHRKIVGREVDSLKKTVSQLPSEPVEEASITKLQEELTASMESKNNIEKLERDLERFKEGREGVVQSIEFDRTTITEHEEKIAELQLKIKALNDTIAEKEERIEKADAEITKQADKVEEAKKAEHRTVAEINDDIANVTATNQKAADYKRRKELEEQQSEKEEQYKAGTAALEALSDYRKMSLDVSQLDIEGLEVVEEYNDDGKRIKYGVFKNGIPVEQLGAAESAIMDLKIQIAMRPQLQILRIDEYRGVFDEKSRKQIEEFGKSVGMPIIAVSVKQDGQDIGIEILDDGFTVNHYEEAK